MIAGAIIPRLKAAERSEAEGFTHSVYEQTPPVSLTLNHLPFQGRQGHFVPAGRQIGDPYNGGAKP